LLLETMGEAKVHQVCKTIRMGLPDLQGIRKDLPVKCLPR
jgi:hypothetical protein